MTLPTTNATMPSEPASFAVTTAINGTLGFEIGRPIVYPFNTRLLIIRSTNSADASVGTVVYDGSDQRVNLVMPASNHWYWARAYVNPGSPTAYTPNTFGVFGSPVGFSTPQIEPGATTFVSQVSCAATQVFSQGGAALGLPLARVDFAANSIGADAQVQITASLRVGLQNIFNFNRVKLRFVCGASSVFDGLSIPIGGSPSAMQPMTLLHTSTYTLGNSAFVSLNWDVASGTNSFTFDNLSLRTEFIKR